MQKLVLPFCFYLLSFLGCATHLSVISPKPPEGIPGVYHRVERGETLWRIAKVYDLDLDELAAANHISDATNIEIGQLIFVPHRKKEINLSNLYGDEDFIWPVKGRVITTFNQVYDNMINKGINIQPYKDKDVVVSRSGRVVFYSPDFKRFGKTVIVEHNGGFLTVYSGIQEVMIKIGESISKGTVIAKISSQAKDKKTYLHFEIRKGCLPKNPLFYLP